MLAKLKTYQPFEHISIAPLATFRILFGLISAFSGIRFLTKGWVEELYLSPTFHFKYYGFSWVKVLPEFWMYAVFGFLIIAAFFVALGFFYRFSIIVFFISFTYIELLDKTTYLNHYYFVSLVAFLLIWLPANRNYSLDARLFPKIRVKKVERWSIDILKFQLGCVYIFAGIAKLNSDWLFEAMPLTNWLKHHSESPIIGSLLEKDFVAYIFSWFGMLYDLFVVFFLILPKTRVLAYVAVIIFHLLTAYLFPIGMFPYVMIGLTLVFFSSNFHERLLSLFELKNGKNQFSFNRKRTKLVLGTFIFIQCIIPFRYLAYPGDLFWNEQGYRFSWRVMLMEKTGSSQFYVEDIEGNKLAVENSDYLTKFQIKQMNTQPDMLLEYSHFLRDKFKDSVIIENNKTINLSDPKIKARVYVRLQGKSQLMLDTNVNLSSQKRGFHHKKWIIPFVK